MTLNTVSAGIFLPNGKFIPNAGDGHAKNAQRFCSKYPEIFSLMNQSPEPNDDFIIQCGFAILASYTYNGNWCFKVAKENPFPEIQKLKSEYQEKGINIWQYWDINPNYLKKIREYPEIVNSIEVNKKETRIVATFLNGKVGFILNNYWYPNMGMGHEGNARGIISNHNWQDEWIKSCMTGQDFIVLNKGAIQLGSSIYSKMIIASSRFYNERDLNIIMARYKLEKISYKTVLY